MLDFVHQCCTCRASLSSKITRHSEASHASPSTSLWAAKGWFGLPVCPTLCLVSNTATKQAIFCRLGSFCTLLDFSGIMLWTTFPTRTCTLWAWFLERGAGVHTALDRLHLFSVPRHQWYRNGITRAWWWCGCAKQQRGSSLLNSSSGKTRKSLTPNMRVWILPTPSFFFSKAVS